MSSVPDGLFSLRRAWYLPMKPLHQTELSICMSAGAEEDAALT